ncbi:hypothetical protein BDZ45DRAFT_806736 [Acephala macrosclerotiorum]|nr:hypothetical protein BDZ45DRAFT_806736 [Acephala macrosclerotiorum]
MNGTEILYPFEYLTQNVVNVTSLDWNVFTSKNLAISNMFVMNIVYEGATSPVAVSGSFNIASKATITSSSSSTSSVVSTFSTGPSTNTIASTAASATVSRSSTPSPDTSGGLSTGVKAGIGIGAPLVAILGVGMGYFIFRWRSQKKATTPTMPTVQVQNNAAEKLVAYCRRAMEHKAKRPNRRSVRLSQWARLIRSNP